MFLLFVGMHSLIQRILIVEPICKGEIIYKASQGIQNMVSQRFGSFKIKHVREQKVTSNTYSLDLFQLPT